MCTCTITLLIDKSTWHSIHFFSYSFEMSHFPLHTSCGQVTAGGAGRGESSCVSGLAASGTITVKSCLMGIFPLMLTTTAPPPQPECLCHNIPLWCHCISHRDQWQMVPQFQGHPSVIYHICCYLAPLLTSKNELRSASISQSFISSYCYYYIIILLLYILLFLQNSSGSQFMFWETSMLLSKRVHGGGAEGDIRQHERPDKMRQPSQWKADVPAGPLQLLYYHAKTVRGNLLNDA